MRSYEYIWGFVLGLLSAAALVALVAIIIKKVTGAKAGKYDERQKLAQGKAYKAAYVVLLVYLIGAGVFDMATGLRWCDEFVFVMIGVLVSIFIYASVCIWNDAYVNVNQSPKTMLIMLGAIALLNLGISIMNLQRGGLIENGMLTYRCVNPLCALMLVLVTAIFGIKQLVDKQKRQDEE